MFCGSGGVGKTSVAAAAALAAAARLGGKVLVLTIDPARRLADALGLEAFGNVARRVPARRVRRARGRAAGRAVGGDARHQALVGRARAAARARRGDRVPHPRQPAVPQRHQPVRAEPRLHRDGAAVRHPRRAASTTSSSSTRRRPGTRSTSSTRRQRMAEFFGGRLLRWLTMPYRIGGGRGGRMFNAASRPFYQMADRVLGSQFLQDIAEFFLNFQSMYGGFVERAQVGRAAAARPAHDVRGRDHARGRAAARGGDVLRGARRRGSSTSARSCSTRRCPNTSCRPTASTPPTCSRDRRRAALAAELGAAPVSPARSPTSSARPRVLRRSPTRSATTRSSPGAKPSCAPS